MTSGAFSHHKEDPLGIVAGFTPQTLNLVQDGLIERTFHHSLYPELLYVQLAEYEDWPANTGTEIFMTRKGLIAPDPKPRKPGVDPSPKQSVYEQWAARLEPYNDTIDTHMPTSVASSINTFLADVHSLGLQAGQTINRVARNALYKAYLSGQTVVTTAGVTGDSTLRVASLNGFRDVIVRGVQVRPTPVSSATPLLVSITGVTGTRGVIAAVPDNADDPDGPGTLVLNATLGASVAARAPVLSSARPLVFRAGGGNSIDAIGSGDIVTLQDFLEIVGRLRDQNVRPMPDGTFHAHITNSTNTQLFADPAFQSALRGQIENARYKNGFIGQVGGLSFFINNETPNRTNSGARTATGTNAYYSEDIGGETTNESGINIARPIVVGMGAIYERGLDESQYVTEAGTTGKIGEFNITNNGVQVMTERIRLILRAPMNRLQDQVSTTWSKSTSYPIPSDVGSGDDARFKRAAILEHAA